jgi:hypothetical protein
MDPVKEFLALITDAVEETGVDLGDAKEEVAAYAAERAEHLATISGEPGFGQAVIAERNSVAMKAGLALSEVADAGQGRWIGMIGGALRIVALALI